MAQQGEAADYYNDGNQAQKGYNGAPPPPQQQQQPYYQSQQQQSYGGPQHMPPPPSYDQAFGNWSEKPTFDQAFKIEKPKWNDIWAALMMRTLLANLRLWTGHPAEAEGLAVRALEGFREAGDRYGVMQALAPLSRAR